MCYKAAIMKTVVSGKHLSRQNWMQSRAGSWNRVETSPNAYKDLVNDKAVFFFNLWNVLSLFCFVFLVYVKQILIAVKKHIKFTILAIFKYTVVLSITMFFNSFTELFHLAKLKLSTH